VSIRLDEDTLRELEETGGIGGSGRATVRRPAEIAGLTYREMLREFRGRNVPFPRSKEELGVNDVARDAR